MEGKGGNGMVVVLVLGGSLVREGEGRGVERSLLRG